MTINLDSRKWCPFGLCVGTRMLMASATMFAISLVFTDLPLFDGLPDQVIDEAYIPR